MLRISLAFLPLAHVEVADVLCASDLRSSTFDLRSPTTLPLSIIDSTHDTGRSLESPDHLSPHSHVQAVLLEHNGENNGSGGGRSRTSSGSEIRNTHRLSIGRLRWMDIKERRLGTQSSEEDVHADISVPSERTCGREFTNAHRTASLAAPTTQSGNPSSGTPATV
ncbi:hypothetical protein CPB84DRAFT_1751563 [Gymnopilus junonius]|uniref:Secreted protein n=1 Tax=Gymnopilus junonius TaxID=109634 RepID=A0A9P5NEX9_GYMJU|nr:hypothetical protein CPB84DRAFT_1751563 [Gymnopilus junonius]